MVRKRGGGTGQGGGGSKRTATSPPVGAIYKDSRRNIQGGEDFDDEDVVIHNKKITEKSIPGNTNQRTVDEVIFEENVIEQMNKASSQRGSVTGTTNKKKSGNIIDELNERASVRGSQAGSVTRQEPSRIKTAYRTGLGEDSLYQTAPPEGCMRDVLTVEVQTRNRENYRGTITYTEAKYEIFMKALDLPEELLHGIKIQFGSGPTITFKLTEQIDIDTLSDVEHFEFKREVGEKNEKRIEYFGCQLRGVRKRKPRTMSDIAEEQEQEERNVYDVTISGCDYSVKEEEMMEWLRVYGETFGKLSENVHREEEYPLAKPTGNGTYTVKMRLDKPIPQFLPMYGKKVRVNYRSQQTMCTNCYGRHPRKVCKSEKVPWMDYVVSFMRNNEDITNSMIGQWFDIAKEEKRVPSRQQARYVEPTPKQPAAQPQRNVENIRQRNPERNQPSSAKEINQKTTRKPDLTVSPKMQQIIALRQETDDMENIVELTSIGLSFEAARDMRASERQIEAVYKVLNKKKESENTINAQLKLSRDEKKKFSTAKRTDYRETTREEKDGEADYAFEW